MVTPVTWRASGTYLGALVHSVHKLGYVELMRSRVDAATQEMMIAPLVNTWWPGERLLSCLAALEEARGPQVVREVSIDLSRERMGPLVRPLASVVLMFTRAPLAALLSRVQTFISSGIHGVDARFVPTHSGAGSVYFTFPEPVPGVMGEVWCGVFDVGFSLAREGRIVGQKIEPTVHRVDLAW
jgi:hypothetical protein